MSRWRAGTVGAIVGAALVPPAVLSAIASAGAGHGDYGAAKLWFPLAMLSTEVFDGITTPVMILSLAQFPFFGWLIGRGLGQVRRWLLFAILFAAHCLLVLAAFSMRPGAFI